LSFSSASKYPSSLQKYPSPRPHHIHVHVHASSYIRVYVTSPIIHVSNFLLYLICVQVLSLVIYVSMSSSSSYTCPNPFPHHMRVQVPPPFYTCPKVPYFIIIYLSKSHYSLYTYIRGYAIGKHVLVSPSINVRVFKSPSLSRHIRVITSISHSYVTL